MAPCSSQFHDLRNLREAGLSTEAERRDVIRAGMYPRSSHHRDAYIRIALERDEPELVERVWDLLGSDRGAAAAAIRALAESPRHVVERAGSLLVDPKAGIREAAVQLFAARGGEDARRILLDRLPNEPAVSVRAEIVSALLDGGLSLDAVADAFPPADLDDYAERGRKVRKPAWKWLDVDALPPPKTAAGGEVPREAMRLMLACQSKQSRPMPDPEVLGLYRLIDRGTSGDFAVGLLDAVNKAARAPNAWALVPAGLLGDNRAVTGLVSALNKWAKGNKEKLAEYAVQALVLNGTDAALSAVGGVADRYRHVGKATQRRAAAAADAALDRLAAGRGLSRADLDESIIPSFGFPVDGTPRVIVAGKRTVHARVGGDFKLSMADADTGKRVASVPKAAGESVVAEFKGLRKLLGEVAKQQTARLERLMVAGNKWDGEAWSSRFLGHPVLAPFAQRLVWATWDGDRPGTLFRALEDGTLTDADDEAVDLPSAGDVVGIVHPLWLDADVLARWREHLADYEVSPPFEQFDRPTARLPDNLADATEDKRLAGTEVGFLSLRGKLERAGWAQDYRGFRRRFAAQNVVAWLSTDGNDWYYGSDPSATVKLGPLSFSKPTAADADENAGRLPPLPLGNVPATAFSEAIGLLHRIAGVAE